MKIKAAFVTSLLLSAFAVAACQGGSSRIPAHVKANQSLPRTVQKKMAAMDMPKNSPILVRIFKEESELEVWKKKRDGRYGLIARYDICTWSGKLGPKYVEGDRQAPEGFYAVTPAQMNPNSKYYLSFNIGFPNAYDQANGRTGRHLMVHGSCSSAGCYSMTDKGIAEIYAFGRDSFMGGQRQFQVHAFPFRMTAQNMARYRKDPNYRFWTMLKEGYDLFESRKTPPRVSVCEKRYVFNRGGSGGLSSTVACPAASPASGMEMAYSVSGQKYEGRFSKAPAPSIAGLAEARLVADWSRRRARGERVTRKPPSLSPASAERAGAPDIARPATVAAKRSVANEITSSTAR